MLKPALGLLLLTGCVPMYVPGALHAPMLQEAGDIHVAAHGGSNGVALNAAYAITNSVGLRASAQGATVRVNSGSGGEETASGSFLSGGGGVSLFYGGDQSVESDFASGVRASVNLEVHGGRSEGRGEFTISLPQSTYSNFSGAFVRPALQGDVGYEWRYFALGAAARVSAVLYTHDAASDFAGQSASILALEPFAFARFGSGNIKFELQGGVCLPLPLAEDENFGLPFPVVVAGGVILDF